MSSDPSPRLDAALAGVAARMVETRRDLHRHPELSHQETRTARIAAARCRELGFSVHEGVGGTGVIADLQGAGAGPTVMYRADMDALPVDEADGDRPAHSEVPGVMHACGHDGHVAIALGVAEVMAGLRDEWRGTLRLCFQPAEEIAGGAEPMIEAGALEGVGRVLGLHLWTPLDAGRVAVTGASLFGSADEFRIVIRGTGGHGGLPHRRHRPCGGRAPDPRFAGGRARPAGGGHRRGDPGWAGSQRHRRAGADGGDRPRPRPGPP